MKINQFTPMFVLTHITDVSGKFRSEQLRDGDISWTNHSAIRQDSPNHIHFPRLHEIWNTGIPINPCLLVVIVFISSVWQNKNWQWSVQSYDGFASVKLRWSSHIHYLIELMIQSHDGFASVKLRWTSQIFYWSDTKSWQFCLC